MAIPYKKKIFDMGAKAFEEGTLLFHEDKFVPESFGRNVTCTIPTTAGETLKDFERMKILIEEMNLSNNKEVALRLSGMTGVVWEKMKPRIFPKRNQDQPADLTPDALTW